jgi:DNA-binding CsgD family transcriptional regulator
VRQPPREGIYKRLIALYLLHNLTLHMQKVNWLTTTDDPELQEAARQKIEALQAFENDCPCVIIVHDITDSTVVYMSRWGVQNLGTTLEALRRLKTEYYDRYFNPEDAKDYVPKIFALLERNNSDEFVTFFQQVRRSPEHEWTWYLSSTKILLRDRHLKPRLTITLAVPVETIHPVASKVDRLMEENSFLRRHHHIFASLTRREKEVLRLMALGVNSTEIAEKLHISEATASTHRRNIRNKIDAHSPYDITRFAQAFDLI